MATGRVRRQVVPAPEPDKDRERLTHVRTATDTPAPQAVAPKGQEGPLSSELTHIVPPAVTPGPQLKPEGPPTVSHPQDSDEREADQAAAAVVGGRAVGPISRAAPGPQRPHREAREPAPAAHPPPEPDASQDIRVTDALNDLEAGDPLAEPVRDQLESRMGAVPDDVRVHTGQRAAAAADALQARAFTHGNGIWLAANASPDDIGLMAHEVTHVLQQSDPDGTPRVRRTVHTAGKSNNTPPPKEKSPYAAGDESWVDPAVKDKVEISPLLLPSWKMAWPAGVKGPEIPLIDVPILKRPEVQNTEGERNTKQTRNWDVAVKSDAEKAVTVKFGGKPSIPSSTPSVSPSTPDIYAMRYSTGQGYVIGTLEAVAQRVGRPGWDREGKPRVFNVDHLQEIQLGGMDDETNYLLLEAGPNQLAGSLINQQINDRIRLAFAKNSPPNPNVNPLEIRTAGKTKVKNIKEGPLGNVPPKQPPYWAINEIGNTDSGPLANLEVMREGDSRLAQLTDKKNQDFIWIVTSKTWGSAIRVPWKGPKGPANLGEAGGYPGFNLTKLVYDETAKEGEVTAETGPKKTEPAKVGPALMPQEIADLKLVPFPGIGRAVKLREGDLEAKLRKLHLWGASPIDVVSAELDDKVGLRARGVLHPTIPLLKDTSVDILLEGDQVTFEKTFSGGSIALPPPLRVTDSWLTLSLGTNGFGISGKVLFGVDRLGTGTLGAEASTSKGFALLGTFDFDSDLFTPAHIEVRYRREGEGDYSFGGTGILGIPENKVRGIRKASVTATFENDTFNASGTAELDVPGVKSGSLDVRQSPEAGFAATGAFQLADNIPGIRGGELTAMIARSPVDNQWKISARGTARPALPGVDAQITAEYEDGAITLEGRAEYAKGMLNGSLLIGATNRPVSADGRPAGPPGKDITAYGDGTVTARLAPWLQGTVGMRILPNGEVELAGRIALPDTLEVFGAKNLEKNLLRIGLDIPIVGVSILGQRIGIFATISGALDADAGIGPGVLRNTALAIVYNPAHEEQTKVTGTAELFIPAHAGLRLYVRGALGAGIPVVSAEAGLEIGGRLGVEGAARAGLQVGWSPAKGLTFNAEASVSAEPVFTFDVNGYVLVEADLWLKTVELYSKRWELAKVAYGSGLRLGLRFPVHYEEGKPFDPSFSDVHFDIPDIDPRQIIGDLVKRIA